MEYYRMKSKRKIEIFIKLDKDSKVIYLKKQEST